MKIVEKKLDEIKPYENNPRFNDDAVQYVANSIKQFGFKVPIIIDKNGVIVSKGKVKKSFSKSSRDKIFYENYLEGIKNGKNRASCEKLRSELCSG